MKAVLASLALFAAGALAQSFTINTPASIVECEPTLLQWSGGQQPYYLASSVLPGATPSGTPIESFPAINSTSYTWTCNIAANTYIGFTLRDSTGALAQSAAVTVQAGSSSSCLTSSGGASGTTESLTSATSTGGAATASSGTTTASSSSASASSSSSSSGASANVAQFGAAGVVGAAVAALFL